MAYFYIRDNSNNENTFTGTASGTGDAARETTLRTGAWDTTAANSFASIQACINQAGGTAPADGDVFIVASDHDHQYSSATNLSYADNITVLSTDVTDQAVYLAGAIESISGTTNDFTITQSASVVNHKGVSFLTADEINAEGDGIIIEWEDCTWGVRTGGNGIGVVHDGQGDASSYKWKNCDIQHIGVGQYFQIERGHYLDFIDCTFSNASPITGALFRGGLLGGIVNCVGCDFSGMMNGAGGGELVSELDNSGADGCYYTFRGCKLGDNVDFNTETITRAGFIDASMCSRDNSTTHDSYHYFFYKDITGVVEEDVAVSYLNATYDGTNGFSVQMDSSAASKRGQPLKYKILTLSDMDLSSANTITVEVTTPDTLTGNELWLEAYSNASSTNEALLSDLDTSFSETAIETGSALTTSTETWAGSTGNQTNRYKLSVTIGAKSGVTNGTVELWAYLAQASATVYVDPAITVT